MNVNVMENMWTVGKFVSSKAVEQSFNMYHKAQSWRKSRGNRGTDYISPDEEIHKILNMYTPEELGEKAEMYLMNLRSDILDIAEEHNNDIRVQIYIHRNSHSFGNGKNCIVINITNSNITLKVKKCGNDTAMADNKDSEFIVTWANSTKNVLKRVSSLNFL